MSQRALLLGRRHLERSRFSAGSLRFAIMGCVSLRQDGSCRIDWLNFWEPRFTFACANHLKGSLRLKD
jgi:hypothetical protein